MVRERLLIYTVYVLRSLKDGKQYTGCTTDLKRRLAEHNAGKTESTRRRRPFVVLHTEEFEDKVGAENREKFLKSGRGREELKRIFSIAPPQASSSAK